MGLSVSVSLFRSAADYPDAEEKVPPPPPQPWVLLPSVPAVVAASGFLPSDTSPRIHVEHPFVSAVDSSGLLLCSSNRVADKPRRYVLWDAAGHITSELPQPDSTHQIRHPCGVGLIVNDGDKRVLVADLQGTAGSNQLCYWTGGDKWILKEIGGCCHWDVSHGVLSHRGRLFWFNFALGLAYCDPFADVPVLSYVPLPQGCDLPRFGRNGHCKLQELTTERCIKISSGRIRFVEINKNLEVATVTMWTLDLDLDDGSSSGQPQWTRTFDVPLSEIWTGWEPPMIGLIDPYNPAILYLSNNYKVFAVDAPARNLLEVIDLSMGFSSSTIHAWIMTPALRRHLQGEKSSSPSIVLGGMPILSRPMRTSTDDLSLQLCHLNLDTLLEVVKRCNLTTVIKFSVSCKVIQRHIRSKYFIQQLGQSSRFAASLFLGYFESYWNRLTPRPQFVPTPLLNAGVLPGMIQASMMEENTIDSLSEFSAIGICNGILVLRSRVDPEVSVWYPLRRLLRFAPQINSARNCACIISSVAKLSFQLMLVMTRPHHGFIRTQVFSPQKQDFDILSRQERPPLAGNWGVVTERQIIGRRARIAKRSAFPVAIGESAYWLCRSDGEYRVLKMPYTVTEEASYISLPATCCLTNEYHRDKLLLVPISPAGRVGGSGEEGMLGFLSLDARGITVWSLDDARGWTQHFSLQRPDHQVSGSATCCGFLV